MFLSPAPVGARPAEATIGDPASRAQSEDPRPIEKSSSQRARQGLLRSGGSLVLLRAFLGVTFTFAGLEKLANPDFFRAGAPGSFAEQLRAAITTSPLHGLLSPATHAPVLVALVISFGELAVGVGTLLGLWSRIAALAGAFLSLVFFLTVSFGDRPYYYGADIVFLFAWTPLAIAGAGAWSLDAFFARLRERTSVDQPRRTTPRPGGPDLSRRAFIRKATVGGVVGAAVLIVGGADALLGRHFAARGKAGLLAGGVTSRSGTTDTSPGKRLVPAADIPVGGAVAFTDPERGIPGFVVQPRRGDYLAFSAICTHAGCPVEFDGGAETFVCPCHGSVFSARNGAVLQGPAFLPLNPIPVALGPGDEIYVDRGASQ